MLKKRLIGVVTVKAGWAVQSFGFGRYLPLGKPECVVENLDRWGADEILVQVIDRSLKQLGPDLELLAKLAKLGISTPLVYAGGISTVADGISVIKNGADRIVIDAMLYDSPKQVLKLAEQLGTQALIASTPLALVDGVINYYNYRTKKQTAVWPELAELVKAAAFSEIFLQDWQSDGQPAAFCEQLATSLSVAAPLILFGGLSDLAKNKRLLALDNVVALAVGNFFNYKEHSVQYFREQIASSQLREANYEREGKLA